MYCDLNVDQDGKFMFFFPYFSLHLLNPGQMNPYISVTRDISHYFHSSSLSSHLLHHTSAPSLIC